MKFTLSFHTDNEAFDGDLEGEIVSIMRDAATRIQAEGLLLEHPEKVRDYNGNKVGTYLLEH